MNAEGSMSEVVFLVEEAPEGGFTARALGHAIFTEVDTFDQIEENARDAVVCHFEEDQRPATIRLHCVKDLVIAV
jgi:hypothetical protein